MTSSTVIVCNGEMETSMTVEQDLLDKYGDRQSKTVGSDDGPRPDEKIYDLVDVISAGAAEDGAEARSGIGSPSGQIHDLVDVVKDDYLVVSCDKELEAAVMKKVSEITERITRELVPDIAERVIREEIEKLKGQR